MIDIREMRDAATAEAESWFPSPPQFSDLRQLEDGPFLVLRVEDDSGSGPFGFAHESGHARLDDATRAARPYILGRLQQYDDAVFGCVDLPSMLKALSVAREGIGAGHCLRLFEVPRILPRPNLIWPREVVFRRTEARLIGDVAPFRGAPAGLWDQLRSGGIAIADAWQRVSDRLGSHPGGIFADDRSTLRYLKLLPTARHAQEEWLAARLYQAAGIAVPDLRLTFRHGSLGVSSTYFGGLRHLHQEAICNVSAWRGFAVDAWLANWDVVGDAFGNLMTSKWPSADGEVTRIDAGGSLRHRALGGPKDFGPVVQELATMRDPEINASAAAVFGGIDAKHLALGARAVEGVTPATIHALVTEARLDNDLAEILIARRADVLAKIPGSAAAV